MRFRFNIKIDDKDYLNYNIFWMIKSPYGKNQVISCRIMITVICSIFAFISLYTKDFSRIILTLVIFVLFQILLPKFLSLTVKIDIKNLKKKGKMGYSPTSVMEFYEDSFVEITPENRIEQQYSSIERISVIDDKIIYIHVNNIAAYILPLSCFESKDLYDSFVDFIKTKCPVADIY